MTYKMYLENQYLREFSSTVRQIVEAEERTGVILAETLFYPSSGGQPHDTGTLNDIPVLDVYQDASQQVVHFLAEPLAGKVGDVSKGLAVLLVRLERSDHRVRPRIGRPRAHPGFHGTANFRLIRHSGFYGNGSDTHNENEQQPQRTACP